MLHGAVPLAPCESENRVVKSYVHDRAIRRCHSEYAPHNAKKETKTTQERRKFSITFEAVPNGLERRVGYDVCAREENGVTLY